MLCMKVIQLSKGLASKSLDKLEKFIDECNKKGYKIISIIPMTSPVGVESLVAIFES